MANCGHTHAHSHAKTLTNGAFLIAIIANGLFVAIQLFFSYFAHSTSLFADAIHNLGDVLSLTVAWFGNRLLSSPRTLKATYGMKKASIVAALFNVVVLVFTCGVIASEAFYKFFSPSPIETTFVIVVAGIGILVNALTAMLFWRKGEDLNIRAAFLHLAYDALVSLGVVLSAILLAKTGWLWLDPLVGLLIAAMILKGSWSLLIDSGRLILDCVPRHISAAKVKAYLKEQPGVKDVHDLHIWALSTQENALSVHLYMPEQPLSDKDRLKLTRQLKDNFQIQHMTIQIEQTDKDCEDACVDYL